MSCLVCRCVYQVQGPYCFWWRWKKVIWGQHSMGLRTSKFVRFRKKNIPHNGIMETTMLLYILAVHLFHLLFNNCKFVNSSNSSLHCRMSSIPTKSLRCSISIHVATSSNTVQPNCNYLKYLTVTLMKWNIDSQVWCKLTCVLNHV